MEKFLNIVAIAIFVIAIAMVVQSHRVSVAIHNTAHRVVTEQVRQYFVENPFQIERSEK